MKEQQKVTVFSSVRQIAQDNKQKLPKLTNPDSFTNLMTWLIEFQQLGLTDRSCNATFECLLLGLQKIGKTLKQIEIKSEQLKQILYRPLPNHIAEELKDAFFIGLAIDHDQRYSKLELNHYFSIVKNQKGEYILVHSWQKSFSLKSWYENVCQKDIVNNTENQMLLDQQPWKSPLAYAMNFFEESQFLDDLVNIKSLKMQFPNQTQYLGVSERFMKILQLMSMPKLGFLCYAK